MSGIVLPCGAQHDGLDLVVYMCFYKLRQLIGVKNGIKVLDLQGNVSDFYPSKLLCMCFPVSIYLPTTIPNFVENLIFIR